VHFALQQHPVQTIAKATERTGLTVPTVTAALKSLEAVGIVRELTGKKRGRIFGYHRYLDVLNEGTTTPPRHLTVAHRSRTRSIPTRESSPARACSRRFAIVAA
jgi:DNA-binding transcriptional ArsR family regulator